VILLQPANKDARLGRYNSPRYGKRRVWQIHRPPPKNANLTGTGIPGDYEDCPNKRPENDNDKKSGAINVSRIHSEILLQPYYGLGVIKKDAIKN